ncbi:MAG: TOBE domain-containing protein [Bacteroidales bacterium]
MNKLPCIIKKITQSGAVILIDAEVDGLNFSALLLEAYTPPVWISENNTVNLVFKETEVSLAKKLSGQISLRNRMKCRVENIVKGEILSCVTLRFNNHIINSLITTRSANSLNLILNDEVEALVKSNEISLMQ